MLNKNQKRKSNWYKQSAFCLIFLLCIFLTACSQEVKDEEDEAEKLVEVMEDNNTETLKPTLTGTREVADTEEPDELIEDSETNTVEDAYENFISNHTYEEYSVDWDTSPEAYCIFDIDQDDTPELLFRLQPELEEWMTIAIFSYDKSKNEIIFHCLAYGWGEINYSNKYQTLVIMDSNPYVGFGEEIFYLLDEHDLRRVFSVGWDSEDNTSIYYFYSDENFEQQIITEDEEKSYENDLIQFDFIPLTA